MNTYYHVDLNGEQFGPYDLETVRGLHLMPDTLLYSNETYAWLPACEYPELDGYTEELVVQDITQYHYHYKDSKGVYGPYSLWELAYLTINQDSLISIDNMATWVFAGGIDGLLGELNNILESTVADEEKEKADVVPQSPINSVNNDDLEELVKIQEREIIDLENKNEELRNSRQATEQVSKESLISEIDAFRKQLRQRTKANFIKSYPSISHKLLDSVDKYQTTYIEYTDLLNSLGLKTQTLLQENNVNYLDKNEIVSAVRVLSDEVLSYLSAELPVLYETADCNQSAWAQLKPQSHHYPVSSFLVGRNLIDYSLFGDLFTIQRNEYATILDSKHIVAYYDSMTKDKCFDFINTLTARMFMASMPGKFSVTTIDAQEMEGVSSLFKCLNKSVFVYSRESEIQKCLESKVQHVENIIRNLLIHPITNLGEYNQSKENPEGYQFIIIKAFPVGLTPSSQLLLKQLMKNGQRAGVHIILLLDKDELNNSEQLQKHVEVFDIAKLNNSTLSYDFVESKYPFTVQGNIQHFHFDNLSTSQIQDVVRYVNSALETKPADVVSFNDYVPSLENWWSRNSANSIEIPFGVSEERELVNLSITQQSGQNSVVVIGVPGSGKSVFLHTIIANAAVNYSPDELELYLMDFSGVEFNTYALNNLPHAKVIAPEAEREFGLSVLRELKEEGSRRMELCRNNEVSNIVDLRTKCPELVVPRLLVIIDEFQKLFEIETDPISREAQVIIHTIIKEFRKFGINLILATQKMSDINSSILPKDLIANRIVFKCSPNDINLIGLNAIPQLRTGECIYNAESGAAFANCKVQSFFISQKETDKLLGKIGNFSRDNLYTPKKTNIFRSAELPTFRLSAITPQAEPKDVNVFFGQPIAISELDVSASLSKLSNDNILIIGGEREVAQGIAINSTLSAMSHYINDTADWHFFNFMRPTDVLYSTPMEYFQTPAFKTTFSSKPDDVVEILACIKEVINARKQDENIEQKHIYLSLYALELAQVFKKGGRRGDDVSEAGQLLSYILNNGPLVGVFSILQVDNYANLQHLGDVVQYFSHRVALQMDKRDSGRIVGSNIANRLYEMNRKSSIYRAYYYNNHNRVTIKFKPYK